MSSWISVLLYLGKVVKHPGQNLVANWSSQLVSKMDPAVSALTPSLDEQQFLK